MGLSICVLILIYTTLVVVLFVNENDFCYYRNCLYNHSYKFSSEKEQVNESQYIVSRLDSVRNCHLGRLGDGGVTPLDFKPGNHVLLKVMPKRGVVRFGK